MKVNDFQFNYSILGTLIFDSMQNNSVQFKINDAVPGNTLAHGIALDALDIYNRKVTTLNATYFIFPFHFRLLK